MEIFGRNVSVVKTKEGQAFCSLCAFDRICNNIKGTVFPCKTVDGKANRYFKEIQKTPRITSPIDEIMYNPSKEV